MGSSFSRSDPLTVDSTTAEAAAVVGKTLAPSQLPNLRWELKSRPRGLVSIDDFRLVEEVVDCDAIEDGEVIVQCEMLSVDAFLRTMLDAEAYHGSIKLGDTVPALGYGRVVASANPKFKRGARVTGMLGARSVARLSKEQTSAGLFPMLSLPRVRPTTFLGLLGLTAGLTAHVGIYSVTKPPRRGHTVVISGASGATGSVAAQLAKRTGARVIGIAGGPAKRAYLLEQLKLDGAVDYKDGEGVGVQLDRLCPDGIDFYFDTVGGSTLDEVLTRVRRNARIVICGASSQYNGNLNVGQVRGPSQYLKLAEKGAQMVGYNVMFYFHRVPLAMLHILWLMWRGKLFMTEQVEPGVRSFAPALVKMFTGGHIGKLLVDVTAGVEKAKAS